MSFCTGTPEIVYLIGNTYKVLGVGTLPLWLISIISTCFYFVTFLFNLTNFILRINITYFLDDVNKFNQIGNDVMFYQLYWLYYLLIL